MNKTELKPCPFCGGRAKHQTFSTKAMLVKLTGHYVVCSVCKAQTSLELTKEEAEAQWNRRVDNAEREAD